MRVSFWDDPYIESLQPLDKLLYIYLFTNPHVNNLGILGISQKKIAFETGLAPGCVASTILLLEKDKKIILDGSATFLVNFIKHQTNTSPKLISSLKKQFMAVESIKIKGELCKRYPQIFGSADTVSIPSDTVSIPSGELERELEREVEEESSLRSDSCAEVAQPPATLEPTLQAEPADISPVVGTLPLTGKDAYGKPRFFEIRQSLVDELAPLYPAVDVMQALRSMKGWLIADPKRWKTKKGIRRFINGWLDRDQNKGGNMAARASPLRDPTTPRNYRECQDLERRQEAARLKAAAGGQDAGFRHGTSGTGTIQPRAVPAKPLDAG